MRLDDLAARWLRLRLRKQKLKPHSLERLELVMRTVRPFFGRLPVRPIGQSQVEAWQVTRGAKVRPRTFNCERDTLRSIINLCEG